MLIPERSDQFAVESRDALGQSDRGRRIGGSCSPSTRPTGKQTATSRVSACPWCRIRQVADYR
jgi:hypothetical protein